MATASSGVSFVDIIKLLSSDMSDTEKEKYYRSELEHLRKLVSDWETDKDKESQKALIEAYKIQQQFYKTNKEFQAKVLETKGKNFRAKQKAITDQVNNTKDNLRALGTVFSRSVESYDQNARTSTRVHDPMNPATGKEDKQNYIRAYLGDLFSRGEVNQFDLDLPYHVQHLRQIYPEIDTEMGSDPQWKSVTKAADESTRSMKLLNDQLDSLGAKVADAQEGEMDDLFAESLGLSDKLTKLRAGKDISTSPTEATKITQEALKESPEYQDLLAQMKSLEGQRTLSMRERLGRVIANPEFRRWADENGFRIGAASVDDKGDLVSYRESNQDWRAVRAWNRQARRGKFDEKPEGSGQIVTAKQNLATDPARHVQMAEKDGVFYFKTQDGGLYSVTPDEGGAGIPQRIQTAPTDLTWKVAAGTKDGKADTFYGIKNLDGSKPVQVKDHQKEPLRSFSVGDKDYIVDPASGKVYDEELNEVTGVKVPDPKTGVKPDYVVLQTPKGETEVGTDKVVEEHEDKDLSAVTTIEELRAGMQQGKTANMISDEEWQAKKGQILSGVSDHAEVKPVDEPEVRELAQKEPDYKTISGKAKASSPATMAAEPGTRPISTADGIVNVPLDTIEVQEPGKHIGMPPSLAQRYGEWLSKKTEPATTEPTEALDAGFSESGEPVLNPITPSKEPPPKPEYDKRYQSIVAVKDENGDITDWQVMTHGEPPKENLAVGVEEGGKRTLRAATPEEKQEPPPVKEEETTTDKVWNPAETVKKETVIRFPETTIPAPPQPSQWDSVYKGEEKLPPAEKKETAPAPARRADMPAREKEPTTTDKQANGQEPTEQPVTKRDTRKQFLSRLLFGAKEPSPAG